MKLRKELIIEKTLEKFAENYRLSEGDEEERKTIHAATDFIYNVEINRRERLNYLKYFENLIWRNE